MSTAHIGLGPCLIDEDQSLGVEIGLAVEPVLTLLQDLRAALLARVSCLFLRVIRWRRKNRWIVPKPN